MTTNDFLDRKMIEEMLDDIDIDFKAPPPPAVVIGESGPVAVPVPEKEEAAAAPVVVYNHHAPDIFSTDIADSDGGGYIKTKIDLGEVSADVPNLTFENSKLNTALTVKIRWVANFREFIYTLLRSVYGDSDDVGGGLAHAKKLAVSNERYIKVWMRAFTDSTFSADNYESMETVGDKLYGCALIKYIYAKTSGAVTSRELSNMNMHFGSGKFMVGISKALCLDKWILKSEGVEMNEKITSNLVESLCGAIDMVCEAVRKHYLDTGDYKTAAICPTGFEAVYRFIRYYFDGAEVDIMAGAYGPSKTFVTQIPDLFGLRGRWSIQKSPDRSGSYVFRIFDGVLITSLVKAVNGTAETERYISGLTGITNADEGRLSDIIMQKLEAAGVTRDWFNDYREKSRVESLYPEALRARFTETYRAKGFSKAVFEYSRDHSSSSAKNKKGSSSVFVGTVMLYGIRRDPTDKKGVNTTRHLLHTETGEVWNNDSAILKNTAANKWISEIEKKKLSPTKQ